MSLESIVVAYLKTPDAPRKRPPLYLPPRKTTTAAVKTPEERRKEIQQRIAAAKLKVETLMHKLNDPSTKSETKMHLRQLKGKAEALLKTLQEKLGEISRFGQEYKAGLKGKALASTTDATVLASLSGFAQDADGYDVLIASYETQAETLLGGAK